MLAVTFAPTLWRRPLRSHNQASLFLCCRSATLRASLTTGTYTMAVGFVALFFNETGDRNTANGDGALQRS